MHQSTAAAHAAMLQELAILRLSGPDVRSFLQGQLSCDLDALTAAEAQLASLNSAQGRVQAVLRLVAREDELLAVMPTELKERVAERLRRYVLRAKVRIDDAQATWSCFAVNAAGIAMLAPQLGAPGPVAGATVHGPNVAALRVAQDEDRFLLLGPPSLDASHPLEDGSAAWRLAGIRAGHPQVYAATWETFVAQMLNLDLLGAISFTKGCYTGQEIIARAHYRGAVKRRMIRLKTSTPPPAPGTRIVAAGTHAGEVVDAEATATGAELLAVVSLARLGEPLQFEAGAPLERLPLPYAID